jgi:hypothetical protein
VLAGAADLQELGFGGKGCHGWGSFL